MWAQIKHIVAATALKDSGNGNPSQRAELWAARLTAYLCGLKLEHRQLTGKYPDILVRGP